MLWKATSSEYPFLGWALSGLHNAVALQALNLWCLPANSAALFAVVGLALNLSCLPVCLSWQRMISMVIAACGSAYMLGANGQSRLGWRPAMVVNGGKSWGKKALADTAWAAYKVTTDACRSHYTGVYL